MRISYVGNKKIKFESNVINANLNNYINISDTFNVYGLSFEDNILYVCIFLDSNLIFTPIDCFMIIDEKIPSYWMIKSDTSGYNIWPEIFFQENFFDDFSNKSENSKNSILDKLV